MKQLWILVGGNGAGKSTFYELMLKPLGIPFINADLIARELYPEDPEGNSYTAEQIRQEQIQVGNTFCFETVFSHPSKIDFLAQANAHRYEIILVLLHLDNPTLNKTRVSQRATEGGHFVPEEKVEQRIPRTLAHVNRAIPLWNEVRIQDNSSSENPFIPVASMIDGRIIHHPGEAPPWPNEIVR